MRIENPSALSRYLSAAIIAIHIIMIPLRLLDESEFCLTKQQTRFMNYPSFLIALRESWANLQNLEFERRRLSLRVSHESLAAQ